MRLSHTTSQLNDNFSRKSQTFPHPGVFNAPAQVVPLELGANAWGEKTRKMRLPDGRRSLTISSTV